MFVSVRVPRFPKPEFKCDLLMGVVIQIETKCVETLYVKRIGGR
jgi:hypothetical protein